MRVLVADDHPLFREAIVRTVRERPEFELVGEAADGRAALEAIRELRPDVAVIDVKMPELDGLQVVAAVRRDELGTRVLRKLDFLNSGASITTMEGNTVRMKSLTTYREPPAPAKKPDSPEKSENTPKE